MRQASRCRMQRVRNAQFHSIILSRPLARRLTGMLSFGYGDKLPPSVYPGRYLTFSKLAPSHGKKALRA